MNVLLSHINEETQIASILKQWIESSLDRDVHVSAETNVRLDQERLLEVNRVLGETRVVLLICSRRSIVRPWINFECGCAWFKGVPVIAVCHSGCAPADLAPPLGNFHAFDLADPASCQALLETLARLLGRERVPRIDYDLMVAELAGTSNGVAVPGAERASAVHDAVPEAEPVAAAAPPAPPAAAQPLELRLLATMRHLPDYRCTAASLAAGLGEPVTTIREHLERLVNSRLLTGQVSTNPSDPDTRYAFTDEGRRYLSKYHR